LPTFDTPIQWGSGSTQTTSFSPGSYDAVDEYEAQLPLTVRQIFYRLVGDHGYEKTERAYSRLTEHLVRACRARSMTCASPHSTGKSWNAR
jgi:hypothetical protein